MYLPQNLHFEVHQVLRLLRKICAFKVLRLPQNLRIKGHRVLRLPRNLQTSHVSKLHDSVHLSRNLSSSTIASMSKVLRLPRKLHFEAKQLRFFAPVTNLKSTLEHQNTGFPLRQPRKVTAVCENAHGATTRAQSLEAPASPTQISRAYADEMHVDDFKRYECTVNSSESARHPRALQRSKQQLLFNYRKNPHSVSTLSGEK